MMDEQEQKQNITVKAATNMGGQIYQMYGTVDSPERQAKRVYTGIDCKFTCFSCKHLHILVKRHIDYHPCYLIFP